MDRHVGGQMHSKLYIITNSIFDIVSALGVTTYSEVRTFLQKRSSISMYKSLTTDMNVTISLTGNHLIYTRKNEMDIFHAL